MKLKDPASIEAPQASFHQRGTKQIGILGAEVSKWRATARTIWRVECPKVASATVTFVEAVKSNHQLSSKVGSILPKLLHTRLDGDELFERYKDL